MAKNKTIDELLNDEKKLDGSKMFHDNMKVYGIDVLEDRALADYRDGFKPAQRRLLKTAEDLHATWNNKTVKSARITGDCFTGETEILTVNNEKIKIKELERMIQNDENVYTFSSSEKGSIEVSRIVKCWEKTKTTKLVRIHLDNGTYFECTPDHKIMLRNGEYKKAIDLEPSTSLMPLKLENNHKVVNVEEINLEIPVAVYNIEVDSKYHNFPLANGIFVKNCMGKYHPHSAAYGSLVSMVNAEYPPIFGQGNWGSLTDGPAAERYTEAKISPIGMKMMECNAVAEYVPNYTGEFMEPVVIPSRFPNFFVNDCAGIAVGLSCNIPAHNLKEIVEAFKVVVKKGKDTKIKDIMKHIKGPEYKYGGHILSSPEEIQALYEKGEGSIKYECDYTLTQEKKNTLLTITGYCPGFSPNTFINKMISMIDDKIVIYVNDSSSKTEPCKLEVLLNNRDDFEKKIRKFLQKTESYRFYAIERTKSTNEEKDVETKILIPNMLELMIKWIDWRKEIETKMCEVDKKINETAKQKSNWRLIASQNLKVVVKGLETDDPIKYIAENLPGLKGTKEAMEGAKYICDQRVISLQKIDQEKIKTDIKNYETKIKELQHDIDHIEEVVLRELDKLKPFYKDRVLKIS